MPTRKGSPRFATTGRKPLPNKALRPVCVSWREWAETGCAGFCATLGGIPAILGEKRCLFESCRGCLAHPPGPARFAAWRPILFGTAVAPKQASATLAGDVFQANWRDHVHSTHNASACSSTSFVASACKSGG